MRNTKSIVSNVRCIKTNLGSHAYSEVKWYRRVVPYFGVLEKKAM